MSLHTRESAANELRVSTSTVDRLVRRGELAATRLGARVLFSDESLNQCIRRNTTLRDCGREPMEVISAELAAMGRHL